MYLVILCEACSIAKTLGMSVCLLASLRGALFRAVVCVLVA